MLDCPFIGIIIGDGTSVEIGYFTVSPTNLPSLQETLTALGAVLGYRLPRVEALKYDLDCKDVPAPPTKLVKQ